MSILVKGMEMPPSCRYCAFRHMSMSQNAFCTASQETIDYMGERTKRLSNCPLIEISPHGRLIDADELLKHKGDAYDSEGHLLYAVGTGSIIAAPTIIEAEEDEE